jgi:hypothetical protein
MGEPEPPIGIPYRNFVRIICNQEQKRRSSKLPKRNPWFVDSESVEGEGCDEANKVKHDRMRVDNVGKNE